MSSYHDLRRDSFETDEPNPYTDIASDLRTGLQVLKDPNTPIDTALAWREVVSMITSEKHPFLHDELHEMALALQAYLEASRVNPRIHLVRRQPLIEKRQEFLERYPKLGHTPVVALPYNLSNKILSFTDPRRLTIENMLDRVFGKPEVHPNTYLPFRDHMADLVALGFLRYKPPISESPNEYFYILRPEEPQEIVQPDSQPAETSNQLLKRIRASIGGTAVPRHRVASENNKTSRRNQQR